MYKMYYKDDKYYKINEKNTIICQKLLDKNTKNAKICKKSQGDNMDKNRKNKNECMIIYEAMYGNKALKNAILNNYQKKDYLSAISDYNALETMWDENLYKEVYKRRTMIELNSIKNLKNLI